MSDFVLYFGHWTQDNRNGFTMLWTLSKCVFKLESVVKDLSQEGCSDLNYEDFIVITIYILFNSDKLCLV